MTDRIFDLPRKDEAGVSYLSYSQMNLFKRDKDGYYRQYILGEPFLGNEWTDFGLKVGGALEKKDFSQFSPPETEILMKVPRLDHFEKEIIVRYPGFYVKGFIDTVDCGYNRVIDYKTGGKDKEHQYADKDYTQLCYYALGLRQQIGITPSVGQVVFIRRGGNPFRGQPLIVAQEEPKIIDVDISINRLKHVYWDTMKIAEEIEQFYLKHKENGKNEKAYTASIQGN